MLRSLGMGGAVMKVDEAGSLGSESGESLLVMEHCGLYKNQVS